MKPVLKGAILILAAFPIFFAPPELAAVYGLALYATALLVLPANQRLGWSGFGLSSLLIGSVLYALGIPDPPQFVWWRFRLSAPGAYEGLRAMLRVVGFFGLGVIAARWIKPTEYLPWIGRRPRRLFVVGSMLRLVPILRDDLERIRLSQAARGHETRRGWLRAGGLLPILVPLFVSTLRRAREQAIAAELAGLNAKRGRR